MLIRPSARCSAPIPPKDPLRAIRMVSKPENCDWHVALSSIPTEKLKEKTTNHALDDLQAGGAVTPKKGLSVPRRMPSTPSKKQSTRVMRKLTKTSRLPEEFYSTSSMHSNGYCQEVASLEECLKFLESVSNSSFDHVRLELFALCEHYRQLYQLERLKM